MTEVRVGVVSTLIFPSEKNQLPFGLRSSLLRRETMPAQPSQGLPHPHPYPVYQNVHL